MAPSPSPSLATPPAWFTRTAVYRQVPLGTRTRLDLTILFRPSGCETLDAIFERFELRKRFRLSPSALRRYARKLEDLVRPAFASQVVAAVLGSLPEHYRQRLATGSQVILLSRLTQALTADANSRLPVADLARLASILNEMAGMPSTAPRRRGRGRSKESPESGNNLSASGHIEQPAKLAEAIRTIYGLDWPPDSPPDEAQLARDNNGT